MKYSGLAGRIARAFIQSKLTPILVVVSLIIGVFVVGITPREEEPQIVVPMIDVTVNYPGASAQEVEQRVTKPMEKLLWEIKGVEYVYSIVRPGSNLTIVRFYVGENTEDSLVKLYNKLMSNYDRIPQGVSQPMVKARSIDDVPILTLTLSSGKSWYSGYELRRIATEVDNEIKKDDNVAETTIIGGQKRQVRVVVNPTKLTAYSLSLVQLCQSIGQSNANLGSGTLSQGNKEYVLETGAFLRDAADVGRVVVGVTNGKPVYLSDVAEIKDGAEEPNSFVFLGLGPAAATKGIAGDRFGQHEAVTISIAKKKGSNASEVAAEALRKVEALKGNLIPSEVSVVVTRNYGETAKEKSDELLQHMLIATVSVVFLIMIALGWRESAVVAVAVPVTLALTLLTSYLLGFTLNRVTLFALIFSIGILVDDAIVVVENIHRHFKMKQVSVDTAVEAVDEVGNPTILATFTVIAALLPMAFVSGLMGPYMRPIPIGAAAAMLFSLAVAFIVSPWLGYKVLKNKSYSTTKPEGTKLHDFYTRVLGPLIDNKQKRRKVLGTVGLLLVLAVMLVPLKMVTVKMLPFDNKSELQVIVDMPESSTLERTAALTHEMGDYLQTVPEVTDYEIYDGTSAPYNFNGLVRHYFLRSGSNVADIQVNLAPKGDRSAQSHEIAKRLRPALKEIGDRYGARVKVAEIPPGPPVLSTLVAEIYGPDGKRQIKIARQVKEIFATTPGVVDVDWYVEDDQPKVVFTVDKEKAAYHNISAATIAQTLQMALTGSSVGLVHFQKENEPVEIMLRLPVEERSELTALPKLTVPDPQGQPVPLSELVTVKETVEDKTIYHKNLKRVTYVIGDVAGELESPGYAILKMKDRIKQLNLSEGYELQQYSAGQPWMEDKYALTWDGEWHITYEVFRDMGIAFAVVLVFIYILVVAWFRSFAVPIVIMIPIPLTLVGILPGHWLFGAFFTATSMIGFIALSGIIVRNSILLVDFIQAELAQGRQLKDAVIEAGAVRFRPIVLTAAAVVVGSFVMLFDPIFQGLAIAMMFGAVVATALTLVAVPLLYYEFFKDKAVSSPHQKQGSSVNTNL